ncbi:MAG: caspase family protein, partial [Vicinamibacteria bacterium]
MTARRRATWIVVLAGLVATAALTSVVRGSDPVTLRPMPEAPRQVALLIGIGDYEHFEDGGKPGQSDLQGPGNDVERIRKSLERFGFVGEDVRILRDSNASKAGIFEAFRWVAGRARNPKDSVVIFYSGHGTFASDLDGDEAEVTPGDTLDEGLVPWDAA